MAINTHLLRHTETSDEPLADLPCQALPAQRTANSSDKPQCTSSSLCNSCNRFPAGTSAVCLAYLPAPPTQSKNLDRPHRIAHNECRCWNQAPASSPAAS